MDRGYGEVFEESEALPGDDPFEAPLRFTHRFAFGDAPGEIVLGGGMDTRAGQHDGVESAVELSIAGSDEPMTGGQPGGGRDRCGAGESAKAASDRNRPACDQLIRTWAALIAPMPGSASSWGRLAVTRWVSSCSRSSASALSVR